MRVASRGSKATSGGPQYCTGSTSFVPSQALQDRKRHEEVMLALSASNDLEAAISTWFSIDEGDQYVYHASVSVKLSQVQRILGQGGANGSHAWYWIIEKGDKRHPLPPPPKTDIEAYVSIFRPATATASALKSFASNAKRSSIRSAAASYLLSKRFIHASHPLFTQLSSIPKVKPTNLHSLPCNPYLDFWAWSCLALEWCGPLPLPLSPSGSPIAATTPSSSSSTPTRPSLTPSNESNPRALSTPSTTSNPRLSKPPENDPSPGSMMTMPPHKSHPLLAIYMHHFGCAVPTHEALVILRVLAAGRTIVDMGSGNGYWTAMLRAYGLSVIPVDSAQSEWRVDWLDTLLEAPSFSSSPGGVGTPGGTILADGPRWLSSQKNEDTTAAIGEEKGKGKGKGGKNLLLLLVYPITGPDGKGIFTRSLVDAYAGDTIAVVGTQNRNGYTGFRDMTVDEYMEREHGDRNDGWQRVVQIPLPSFAGKDEALIVFQRGGERLGPTDTGPM